MKNNNSQIELDNQYCSFCGTNLVLNIDYKKKEIFLVCPFCGKEFNQSNISFLNKNFLKELIF